jgi:hypothetical protein
MSMRGGAAGSALSKERIQHRGGGIGHQNHVGLVDALPSGDRRAVEHLAVDEEVLVDHAGRDGDVLFLAPRVRKAQVAVGRVFLLDEFDDFSGGHGSLRHSAGDGSRSLCWCKDRATRAWKLISL